MRILYFLLSIVITVALILILNSKMVLPAPLGKLLAPQSGLWQNAEARDEDFSADFSFPNLKANTSVYFDDRLVPHVFAEDENDAYFVQGFLHAKFRLWQMDLQVRSAAGRVSELFGDIALDHDREFRRLGMVYAAENSLRSMESDPIIKASCDAYTAGVNAYIESLSAATLPLEYKLLGYTPERWSNFKSALFLKYMSYDLAAHENDFELTNARSFFSQEEFDLLYPANQDSLDPIVPKGTVFSAPATALARPATFDSLFVKDTVDIIKANNPDPANGSNNWAVSGSKTATGAPILCNDPHLGLNLPSLWYEMQLSTPAFNAYGVSFPGAPSVIIGFNDSCAFGFTNGGRDVRDYYEIKFKDDSRQQYWFNNQWQKTDFRYEEIKIAGKPTLIDTVAYTVFGPVMFDASYSGKRSNNKKNIAVKWKAHDASNELAIFNKLNHAKNYADYLDAVTNLHTPGQNVVFATKGGDIAIRTQGEWPAKWKGQGDFIMPGTDSTYLWQYMIPQSEVPFQYNPERGFVSSANQRPVDSTYPYYLGREYPSPRGFIINRMLSNMQNMTAQDMMKMQTDNYNVFAEMARPLLLKNINEAALNISGKKYVADLRSWDLRNDTASTGATIFAVVWKQLRSVIFDDEFTNAPSPILAPFESTLLESLLRDSAWRFIDNKMTDSKESLQEMVTLAFEKSAVKLDSLSTVDRLQWAKYKDTRVAHLTKLPAFSSLHLPIGGGTHIINAANENHGPSWRMVVSLTQETEAYGIYPGGQSGNPGSRYYDSFVQDWAVGKYYPLWVMKKEERKSEKIKYTMNFKKA